MAQISQAHEQNKDSVTWPRDRWAAWIAERLDARELVYTTDPIELISAYRREMGYANDYHGREMLELLQNADDAGVAMDESNRATIVLTPAGLCVANTGTPFSDGGVQSLMVTDASPKYLDRRHYIGNRGLGFRSVLNWTDCPFILSGNLAVGFDAKQAAEWLHRLCGRAPALCAMVERESKAAGGVVPMPKLAVPIVLDPCAVTSGMRLSAATFSTVWACAEALIAEGYATVIAVPFTHATFFHEALEQLHHIGRDALLFTKHLESLTIRTPEGESRWAVERDANTLRISHDNDHPESFHLFGTGGRIPEELLEERQKVASEYEVTVAVPLHDTTLPGVLFDFFPTRVLFPYPLIAHVTMELTNNRQDVVESKANKFLADRLAVCMATAAEVCADVSIPWRGLSIITATGDIGLGLRKLGFQDSLAVAAKTRKLVPVRGGNIVCPATARRLKADAKDWLPLVNFEDVTLWPEARILHKTLDTLNVPFMSEDQLLCRLNSLNKISPPMYARERAALIAGLVQSGIIPHNPAPDLLVDERDEVILAAQAVFLPPSDDTSSLSSSKPREITIQLPSWMELTLLSSALLSRLRTAFGELTVRQLTSKLRPAYDVHEFSLEALTANISAAAGTQSKSDPKNACRYHTEAVRAIYALYQRSSDGGLRPSQHSTRAQVQLLTTTGVFEPAANLYLSADYRGGTLTDALYRCVAPERIVASPMAMGLDQHDDGLVGFLTWLGVASMPRERSDIGAPQDFTKYVVSQLRYPAEFNYGFIAHRPADWMRASMRVTAIDRLEDILRRAAPEAVLAWVALDMRLESWRVSGDRGAKLGVLLPRAQYERTLQDQPLPSYVNWLLEHASWLPTTRGSLEAPHRCFLTVPSDDLQSLLPQPAISDHNLLGQLGIDRKRMRSALERIGVKPSLDDLSWDEFYDILLELPQIDTSGKRARAVYRALIAHPEDTLPSGQARERFLREGKLWGQRGDEGSYEAPRRLLYADSTIVPDLIRREVMLLDLDRKRGAQKVQRLFGVNPLDRRAVALHVTDFRSNVHGDAFTLEINQLKPFIAALRLSMDRDAGRISTLAALNFTLCESALGTALVNDEPIPVTLEKLGDAVVDGDMVYIVADADDGLPVLGNTLIADAIGEVLAEVLQVERSSDFARLASCPSNQRNGLLARMAGIDEAEAAMLLEEAINGASIDIETGDAENALTRPFIQPPGVPPSVTAEGGTRLVGGSDGEQAIGSSDDVGPVVAAQREHRLHTPTKVRLQVQRTPDGMARSSRGRRVTNAVRCQNLAARFEDEQGRFPLLVDHLRGEDAFGCDVLSFETTELRNQFEQQPNRDLVLRFIEVKGRSSGRGSVELGGNELHAARTYRDRYYLYRVYESAVGAFELQILADPAYAQHSIVYHIDVSSDPRTMSWIVTERAMELSADVESHP